jgi:hypothetical protein
LGIRLPLMHKCTSVQIIGRINAWQAQTPTFQGFADKASSATTTASPWPQFVEPGFALVEAVTQVNLARLGLGNWAERLLRRKERRKTIRAIVPSGVHWGKIGIV